MRGGQVGKKRIKRVNKERLKVLRNQLFVGLQL